MTSYVKYFHSELPGAPVLSGTVGSLLAVLDACLVNGWGLLTASAVSVSGGVATATFSTSHSYEIDGVILVAGASTPALNGEQRVTATGSLTVSWSAPGVADGPVSGTITVKLAPAGWIKLAGVNRAAYKSSNPSATQCWIRIDDANARYARIRGYESMTDVDTGTGMFPDDVQASGGLYVQKSNVADASFRRWMIIATDCQVFILTAYYSSFGYDYTPVFFGDALSIKPGDAYRCMLAGDAADWSTYNYVGAGVPLVSADASGGVFWARSYVQVGGAQVGTLRHPGLLSNSGNPVHPTGPNPINNSLYVIPTLAFDGTGAAANYRGVVPGIYSIPHNVGANFGSKSKTVGADGLPGRTLLGVHYQSAAVSGGYRYMIDISGPWS